MEFELKGNYFNGSFVKIETDALETDTRFVKKLNPSNLGHKLWELPLIYDHIDAVIESANIGFERWRKTSIDDRIQALRRFQEIAISRETEIATAISLETGKPMWEAITEAKAIAAKVNVTIEESLPRIKTKNYESILPATNASVSFKPIGPSLIIGPFNFPCHLANGQIVNTLLAGNSIIFKPSDKTSYCGEILIDCLHQANFPEGVINLIQGDGELARRLLREKSVKGVFFTGSKEVGLKVLKETYQDLSKLVSLELGGKNPAIVFEDGYSEATVYELLKGCFLTAGQRCTSTSIIALQRPLVDKFIEQFHQLSKNIIVDHPTEFDQEPFMGPLIDQAAVESYLLYIGMATREGIEEIMRGKALEKKYPGHYVTPSIHLAQKFDPKSHFLTSEIFGPNATIIPFDTKEEAFEIANATEYGLAASIFTKNDQNYQDALMELDFGLINRNRSTVGASSKLPFGGVKNSGNYRPAAVSTIDYSVYQVASLDVLEEKVEIPKGLKD
ncbi:MAG: aldehyde dehydrogenase family protein [Bacteriovoracaceae bacterium]